MLDLLGLDHQTESVYRAMLAHPEDGVEGLVSRLGRPAKEIRDALDRLSELALVRFSTEDPTQLHAVSPHLGIEILLARQQAELAAQQQRVEASRAVAARLISEFAGQQEDVPDAGVQYLRGLESIRDYLTALNHQVRHEFLAFAPGGPQTEANMQASRPLNQRLLERGVQMRTIYLDSIRRDAATVAYAEWLMDKGAQVRTVPSLPNRMIICDRQVAIMAADSNATSVGAVVLSAPGLIASLCTLFDTTWQAAEALGTPPGREQEGLTRQQAEVLHLLAEGHTDDAIARKLGVSPRTARRFANTLMAQLDARSRFQAGVRAVQYGYLPASVG
ncbi:LuxR C-terminal-related transcriptional regulator [Streptomyces sp. NBC_01171]|uniref:LuxR C-terminal-related transcriptional regulator n=1 Tax=Streptomyces sp. NBC_01171 TaxID=2903757 RepID=UPI00386C31FD|nr:LuxR C-terminal-related transcriptional regulator [Streptomyces sp. NBC_01171]